MDKKGFFLFLMVVLLAVILVPSVMVIAQPPPPGKTDLTLFLTPGNYSNNITPGQDNISYLEVRNNGASSITNIHFTSTAPNGWAVNIAPDSMDSLGPSSSNTVNVSIIPPKDASNGNYNVTIIAQASETRAVTTAYLSIQGNPSVWLWIGIGIAVVVIIGFVIVFLKFGKQ